MRAGPLIKFCQNIAPEYFKARAIDWWNTTWGLVFMRLYLNNTCWSSCMCLKLIVMARFSAHTARSADSKYFIDWALPFFIIFLLWWVHIHKWKELNPASNPGFCVCICLLSYFSMMVAFVLLSQRRKRSHSTVQYIS